MADEGNVLLSSIQGQNLENKKLVDGKLAVKKDGGDVDALTAATISSRAYVDAVNRAWMALQERSLRHRGHRFRFGRHEARRCTNQ